MTEPSGSDTNTGRNLNTLTTGADQEVSTTVLFHPGGQYLASDRAGKGTPLGYSDGAVIRDFDRCIGPNPDYTLGGVDIFVLQHDGPLSSLQAHRRKDRDLGHQHREQPQFRGTYRHDEWIIGESRPQIARLMQLRWFHRLSELTNLHIPRLAQNGSRSEGLGVRPGSGFFRAKKPEPGADPIDFIATNYYRRPENFRENNREQAPEAFVSWLHSYPDWPTREALSLEQFGTGPFVGTWSGTYTAPVTVDFTPTQDYWSGQHRHLP